MNVIATNETGLADRHCRIRRVWPKRIDDLPAVIIRHAAKSRYADVKHYRLEVASTAAALVDYVRDEAAKQRINTDRASGRNRGAE